MLRFLSGSSEGRPIGLDELSVDKENATLLHTVKEGSIDEDGNVVAHEDLDLYITNRNESVSFTVYFLLGANAPNPELIARRVPPGETVPLLTDGLLTVAVSGMEIKAYAKVVPGSTGGVKALSIFGSLEVISE